MSKNFTNARIQALGLGMQVRAVDKRPALRGNTYEFKDALKASGATWDNATGCWLLPDAAALEAAIAALIASGANPEKGLAPIKAAIAALLAKARKSYERLNDAAKAGSAVIVDVLATPEGELLADAAAVAAEMDRQAWGALEITRKNGLVIPDIGPMWAADLAELAIAKRLAKIQAANH